MPRYKAQYRSGSIETYKKFRKENPEYKGKFKEFHNIILELNEALMTHIMLTGEKVKLPYGFGPLTITKKPKEYFFTGKDGVRHTILPIDWVETKKKGKHVYLMNGHTSGWRCRWFWEPHKSYIYCPEIWEFIPARIKYKIGLKDLLVNNPDHIHTYHEWSTSRFKRRGL